MMPRHILPPAEVKESFYKRTLRAAERTTPWPRCLATCTVSETYTTRECRLVCPSRFKEERKPD